MEVLAVYEEPEGTRGGLLAFVLFVDEQFNEYRQQTCSGTQRLVSSFG